MLLLLALACGGDPDSKDSDTGRVDADTDTDSDSDTDTDSDSDSDSDSVSDTDSDTDTDTDSDTDAGGDPVDADGDGHVSEATGGDDCDDTDATVYPGAPTVCEDDVVNDCDLDSEAGVCATCTGSLDASAAITFGGAEDEGVYNLQRVDDWDGDGVQDLVAIGAGDGTLHNSKLWFWGSAAGAGLPSDTSSATATYVDDSDAAAWFGNFGDVTGDGVDELAILDSNQLVLLPTSALTSGATLTRADASVILGSSDPYWYAAGGDFDGDGARDAGISDYYIKHDYKDEGAIYLYDQATLAAGGTLDGGPADTWIYGGVSGAAIMLISAVDLDGDGSDDLTASYFSHGSDTTDVVFMGPLPDGEVPMADADYSFALSMDRSLGLTSVGDLDGDGRPDLATYRFYTEGAFVYLSGGALATPGAIDPDAYDLDFHAGSGWTATRLSSLGGDFDGDGQADVFLGMYSSLSKLGAAVYPGPFTSSGSYTDADAVTTISVPYTLGKDSARTAGAAAGDLDLDGQPDLILGASCQDDTAENGGVAWIFEGCTP